MSHDLAARLRATYEDLHASPELSGEEQRTAALVAAWLREAGYDVREGVGGTGVVGVLANGDGPVVWLRADMDALPVTEDTGLPYASTVAGVMHACGHDVHTTCLLGAATTLAAERATWAGTVVLIFQPAEETVSGARAMTADPLFADLPAPVVVLGQHVAPLPAGALGLRPGPAFAASDSLTVTLYGRGGHGSRPDATIDPVVMAASTVLRLQTIASREIAATDPVVVTVGAINAGTRPNIIPDTAELQLSIRTYEEPVRAQVLAAVERIVRGEAAAAGAEREPSVQPRESSPRVLNDLAACERTRGALESVVGAGRVIDPGLVTGSEDVGVIAAAAGAPLVFWLLGGADPQAYAGATTFEEMVAVLASLPSNHSPKYAPVPEPTLTFGVAALVAAARAWLDAT